MRRLLALLLLAVVLTLALPAVAYAADWYVAITGSDVTGDGSAASPFASVQVAIDTAAIAAGAPHTVHVGVGTFLGNISMRDGVSVRGVSAGVTIIQGTGSGPVITCTDIGAGETLEGLEITGGVDHSVFGGGISCNGSSPTITGNTIWGNHGYFGGGIGCRNSSPTITGNTIRDNFGDYGGGIGGTGSSPVISDNTIANNEAELGGGIGIFDYSSPTITGNTITGNYGDTGGGITTMGSTPVISGNVITGNSTGTGGGINDTESASFVENNLIAGNTAIYGGGGVYCYRSTTTFVNNTIADNQGGALELLDSSVTIANCIIWRSGSTNGLGIDVPNGLPPAITHSCVQGGWAGTGNINADPLFVDAPAGLYGLRLGSPCIDAGTALGAPVADLAGRARPQGVGIDMGAYEYPTHAVTFDSQGGSAVAAQDVFETGLVARPADPTRAGFTFGGWCTEAACTHVWDFAADTVTAPVTLYAKWTPIPITGMNAAYTMYAGDSLTIDAKPDGGTWGWDAACFSATFNSPATFTALRTGSSVVTYTLNGATASATITVLARPVSAVTTARTLPATGANIAPTMLAALLAACAGVVLRVSSRKA